ncbi:YkyB family protein [Rummeliibacillus pycnus]|uniref:YkyB family protein n=1 Tax=Rummeliibacillus pycnus TaxID=101070 RepID=UPI003D271B95
MSNYYKDREIATAIYTVNKHAKTALDNRSLYTLKRLALEKMIRTGRANRLGLHFVKKPRYSQQQSAVVIQCADYYFHTLPKKEDFKQLPHLGHLDETYRNPRRNMSLNVAKSIINDFLDLSCTKQLTKKKKLTPKKIHDEKVKHDYYKNSSYFYGH